MRGKNKKEKLGGFFSRITKSVDESLLSGQKDVDDFFEAEKVFLIEYHAKIKDATTKADKMTRVHKSELAIPISDFPSVSVHAASALDILTGQVMLLYFQDVK